MANYTEIQGLFNDHLAALPDLPPWKRENRHFQPDEETLYIESYLVPAPSRNPFLGSDANTYESGDFMVLVKCVRGQGWGYGYEWVDQIVEHFKRNTILTNSAACISVKTSKAYPVLGFYGEDGRYVIPIHIEYFAYIPI